ECGEYGSISLGEESRKGHATMAFPNSKDYPLALEPRFASGGLWRLTPPDRSGGLGRPRRAPWPDPCQRGIAPPIGITRRRDQAQTTCPRSRRRRRWLDRGTLSA